MNTLLGDIVYAWRGARKRPGASLLIVLTLGLGIGVNTAMFSVTWHVLLAPLPYTDGDRLVRLEQRDARNPFGDQPWSVPTLADLRAQNTVFTHVLQYFRGTFTLQSAGGPFQVESAAVDGNFFALLGLQPALGRLITPDDDRAGAAPVIVLDNRFWMEAFGGNPDALGSTLEMNNVVYTVVGVLPDIPPYPHVNDVWVPVASDQVMSHDSVMNRRDNPVISHVIGRLGEGISLNQAREELALFAERLRENYPEVYAAEPGYTVGVRPLKEDITGASARTVGLLSCLAALVVLIACINFANITLAGVLRRSQELAIREAVGAAPGRIRWQLITENTLMAVIGGLVGLGLAVMGLDFATEFAAIYTPLAGRIRFDAGVLGFCLALTVATGLLSALIASVQARDLHRTLKEGGDKATVAPGAKRLRDALLAAQCALTFFMLTSTALMTSSLYRLVTQPTGYDTEGVVVLRTTMRGMDMAAMWRERDMMLQVLDETRALPGVSAAGITGIPLLQDPYFLPQPQPMQIEGSGTGGSNETLSEYLTTVSEGFFEVTGVALLAGRDFARSDDENAPEMVIVNATFAARYFPEDAAVGQRLSLNGGNSWATIIGVIDDVRSRDIDTPDTAMVYKHYVRSPTQRINLYVKTSADLGATAEAVAAVIRRLDPLQPVDTIAPLATIKDQWLAPTRLRTGLIAAFGVLALVVTLSGVVGVASLNVNERVREIGVHMAMGANPAGIVRLFMAQGLKVYMFGLGLGLAIIYFATPLLTPLLYETSAFDGGIYVLSAVALSLAVLVALYLPAARASRMSPVAALRVE